MTNILTQTNTDVLDDLLSRCNSIESIDVDYIKKLCKDTLSANIWQRPLPDDLKSLFDKWYESLPENPDYSVYEKQQYIAELWACWAYYSKNHLKNIQKPKSFIEDSITNQHMDSQLVVDLGCGFGHTTTALKQVFTQSKVVGTNIEGTLQMKVAKTMAADYDFSMVGDIRDIDGKADLIFASEYFEHFEKPLDHLDEVISVLQPKALLIANSFGPKAIGHFSDYQVKINELFDYHPMSAKETGKLFNSTMKSYGYQRMNTKLWNDHVIYWVKTKEWRND